MNEPRKQAVLDQYPDETFLFADGFDAAILGVAGGFDELRVVYSVSKILEILMITDGASDDDDDKYTSAREHFDYNIGGGYVGPKTPIWVEDEMFGELYEHESSMENGSQNDLGVAARTDDLDGKAGCGQVPALQDGGAADG